MDRRLSERLSLTGPGTPCGELLRRYWFPIAISEELTDLPKLVRFLGEDLVLFRDGGGRAGLLGKHCSHRGTSLEYGQIDEEGIRCCYHAWLYDIEGHVLDTPAEPPESNFKYSIRHLAYPCRELGGWIFTYMGPPEKMPELPRYDFLVREDGTRDLWAAPADCNWFQRVENHPDTVHTSLLHRIPSKWMFGDHRTELPDFGEERSEDGMTWSEIRPTFRRQARFIVPNVALLPEVNERTALRDGTPPPEPYTLAMWTVPIDDTHHVDFRMQFVPHVNGKPRADHNRPARPTPKTYEEKQRAPGDTEAQEGQGPIVRRDRWHLASSDRGVLMIQQIIMDAIDTVERGEDPTGIIRDPAEAAYIDTRPLIGTSYEPTALDPWRLERNVWGKRVGVVVR